ncbi:MAG: hypothetical protein ACE366_29720 [Bradymonadia bacterium]
MISRRVSAALGVLAFIGCLVAPAGAQLANEGERCAPDEPEMSPHRYLRSVSLDVRGVVPTLEEYAALDAALAEMPEGEDQKVEGVLPWFEAQIDTWMDTPEFTERVVRRHQALLWNNLSNVRLFNNNVNMQRAGDLYYRANIGQRLYRGARVACLDEPAEFGPEGEVLFQTDENGVRREGWVWVNPYWAPESRIKVCAFDAQAAETSPTGTDCGSSAAYRDTACGCGPDLQWCQYRGQTNNAIVAGMAEAMKRRMALVAEASTPYIDLFRTRRTWINGPLAFFYRHQRKITGGLAFDPGPLPDYLIPELEFTEADTWVEVELPASHAGVLTDPAFLLRFQTNRARANRFYDAFLCQPFTPPDAPLPVADEAAALEPDLQRRAGCKYCHALLEPSAAYWGRWNEQGAGFLDPQGYPQVRDDCLTCAQEGGGCSADCRRYYVTQALSDAEAPYLGTLRAYLFRRDPHMRNVEMGPELLALTAVADGRIPQCAATRTAEWLLGRDLDVKESTWAAELSADFVYSDYSYRQLIKAVLTSSVYRRVR